MADKVKKKPFFTLKRWNSQKQSDYVLGTISPITPSPRGQSQDNTELCRSHNSLATRTMNSVSDSKPRKLSAGGIKELVQCPLCLDVLHNPKMLPCQHTFCMTCLNSYIGDKPIFECPICKTKIQVQGPNFIRDLPSNLYIDSLLNIVGIHNKPQKNPETPPATPTTPGTQSVDLFAVGLRCSNCKSHCDNTNITSCEHCRLKFCGVCWSQHLDDMRTQIGSILKQLDSATNRLNHKIEHFKDRCERITEQINKTAEDKINAIIDSKNNMLIEAVSLQKSGDMSALALKTSLEEAKTVASKAMTVSDGVNIDGEQQVTTFMNLHQNAIQLLTDVIKWDTEGFVFDKENFTLEVDSTTPVDAESEDPVSEGSKHNDPLESEESLVTYYRSRNFIPHYVWRKTSRPSGVGLSPWDSHLYVCGMDSHSVMVVERAQAKIVTRLTCDEMLCPVQIAFMKSQGEIYVTDKWKHCIHVFSKDGLYLRSIGHKGSRVGMFRSPEGIATDNANNLIYVADTGNDRVQIIQPDGKFVDQIGVYNKLKPTGNTTLWETKEVICTELNTPTAVALTADRIIILDSGNRRVKVYNKNDKGKILEFGSTGQRKGQFRQPEVLAVDPMGYILVGDSGNCRVQVFKPTGQLVRVFGGFGTQPGKFGWISGIHVTKHLDIIICDTKNHTVNFL
ncbi:RING finger protein nhl-1 [Bombyx mori]|uniref:RING-type domain-containing protein n=1 Tax=Bombyx mori TaxID=7091 RepID=A0A8R1WPQ1_BOMMO|nr:RING finger protein nhl-1 [Bombyx mori]